MTAEYVYNEFCKFAESDEHYYNFGKHGVIEDALAWFNIPSEHFLGAPSAVHTRNLEKLHKFLLTATEDQLRWVLSVCHKGCVTDKIDISDNASGHVFVSMPMNMEKCDRVDEIREGISDGLIKAGEVPYFLDYDQHHENIYDVMMNNIRNCKFLIADLTSQNQGVYFEAGYAKALAKTVIFSCHSSDKDKRHFDVSQIRTIFWDSSEDLSRQVFEDVKAMKRRGVG